MERRRARTGRGNTTGRGLHHIALGARDVERVAAFYRDLLGLRELTRHRRDGEALRSVWLDLGGAVLMIERTAEPQRHVVGIGAGPFLIALAADPGDLDAMERLLEAAGFPAESRTEDTRYFRDPEGNRVAISRYPLPRHSD